MATKYDILKAVEFDKLSALTKRTHGSAQGLVDAGWWTQKKYDGIFAKVTLRAGGVHFMETRTGEPIQSCDHVLQALGRESPPHDLVILGELWHRTYPFPVISGMVRRSLSSPGILFVANDILPLGMETERPYEDRFELDLLPFLNAQRRRGGHVISAETYQGAPRMPVEALAARWVAEGGFDGAILRDPAAGYRIGKASYGEIVKVKPTLSLDLRVVRFRIDKGEKTGRPVYTADVEYKGAVTTVGAGMPHTAAACPAIGMIIEVECLGITADGKLREPRFKGIRHDKLEPDA